MDFTNKYVIAGIVVAAVVIGATIYYVYYRRHQSKSPFTDVDLDEAVTEAAKLKELERARRSQPTLVFFHATWCPHCQNMMDAWRQTEKELLGKINTRAIESADPDMASYTIEGFPTIRLF